MGRNWKLKELGPELPQLQSKWISSMVSGDLAIFFLSPKNIFLIAKPWWLGVLIRQLSLSVDPCGNVHGGFESAWKQLSICSE